MDSKQQPDDDGVTRIQRLIPGQVDVVLGSHPRKKRVVRSGDAPPFGLWLAGLVLVGCLSAWIASQLKGPRAAPQPVAEPPSISMETERTSPLDQAPALRQEAYVVRPPAPAYQAVTAQPLDNCMKTGNVIDEHVASCRFGQMPRPAQSEPAKGMVSAGYMATFKANGARNDPRPSRPYKVATVSIREWDGRNRYRAQWRVYANTIAGDSVCENFLSRSVERRECRKSAQVNFKEQCREWTRRAARDRDQESKKAEQRYCEAASTFTP
jgi:hypothetical protein